MIYSSYSVCLLIAISTLKCESGNERNDRLRTAISNDQPRITSNNGNLIFQTGNLKNIEFKTSSSGRIKLNNDDLEQHLIQIRKNKDDIVELKTSGGHIPQNVSNQIIQLNARLLSLEASVQAVQSILQRRACTSNPCQNDGRCLDLIDSFFCLCPNNWKGLTCSDDINECQVYAGSSLACQNGATCVNTEGSYRCNCTPEWYGPHCTFKYDDCQGGSKAVCEHGICIDSERVQPNQPKFQCICDAGWTHAPTNSSCSSDIDECHLPVYPCSTNPPVKCTNSLGSYHCEACPAGYQGDGKTCTLVDVCSINNGGCHPSASCIFSPDNILTCTCPPDYIGNGYGASGCVPLNNICQHDNPCANGQCVFTISGYVCICDPGWTSTNCTENINECVSNPCQNGGSCTDGVNFYSCTCTNEWTGPQCRIPQQVDPACGGTYEDSKGILTTPSWPNAYPSNRQCIYIIQQPIGERIHLQFTHMDLESNNSCSSVYVEVHDGETELDPLINKFCGSTLPAPITSNGNKLWIKFKADISVSKGGFIALYEVACGGTLNGNGVIKSPYYPKTYPHDKVCEWVINQPEGQVVTLNFISFDIENATNCNNDYVEVKDGPVIDSPLIGKYCGTNIPPIIQSMQRSMFVKFKTDSKISSHGFQVKYGSAVKGCTEVLTKPVGTISSPGYPTDYPHGAKCIWYISVQPGNVIRLTFDFFNLEYHMNCAKDYVEVFDNGTIFYGRLIGRFCGRSVPPSVTSSGSLMSLLFVSDSSIAIQGFAASYDSLDASSVCREEFFEFTGTLTSPNYPNGYSRNQECIYTINVENNKQILLNFTHFCLDGYQTCTSGYVEIRNGGYETSPLVGQYCGSKAPPLITSHSNQLWIKFKSDNTLQYRVFKARWDGTTTGCGGTLITSTGSFTSPNYPMPYSHNAECYWLIQTSAGSVIELQFEQFHLDSSAGCNYDYLAVYNGNNSNSQLLAKLCGRQILAPILSPGNSMYIKLRTDSSVTAGGFFAKYAHICQGVIIANRSQGILESINFPRPYPSKQDCTWTIQATAGNTINYTFTIFSLDFNKCHLAWLKLYDGPSAQSPLIGTFCGNSIPPSGTSSGSRLHVAFHSDSSFSGNGFQMLWLQNGCGGELLGPKGRFSSPGYPDPYPHNQECIWVIHGDSGSSIELTIHEFDVEYHQTCNFDVLEVYGGPDITSVRLAQLCRTRPPNNPLVVSSTGNYITVRFKTNSNSSAKGFNATWKQIAGGCGGNFTAPNGEIHSPNYPSPYGSNVDCSWVITVDYHHCVLLDFADFDLEHHQSCDSDYVAVYDGWNEAAPMLGKLCGSLIPKRITSTHNVIYVRFRSNDSNEHKGFRAQFDQACGSYIITDDIGGVITSPLYPKNYLDNQKCSWIIRAQKPFNHVTVSFTDFEIENGGPNCSADALQILDGDNYAAPSIGRYCGNIMPHPITSFSDALFVNFSSNNVNTFKGFRTVYAASTSACGGMYHMETGAFNSPNFPDESPPNYECVWYIITSPGNRVQLSFISFDIGLNINCNSAYLEIREGNSTGQLIGRYCGSSLPANYTSVKIHILWVKFVSDPISPGGRFSAIFSHLYGNEIVGFQGQIASPLWPLHYPHNANYHWTITVPASYIVHVRILELDIDALHECRYDNLMFYDGPNIYERVIGKFCGFELPPDLSSTGSTMTVQFMSDSSLNGKGFLLEWYAVLHIIDPTAIPTVQPGACGGVVVTADTPTFLFSPGWPNMYENHLDCSWVIRAPQGTVELNILALDIEPNVRCFYDKLVIRDGDNSHSPVLATLCGRQLPGPVRSSGDAMFIRFTSDEETNGGGFNASYYKTCGGRLNANHGVILSPNYPNAYTSNLNCTWLVAVTSGSIISIHFNWTFQVQGSGVNCTTGDYLELRNGLDVSSPPLTTHGRNGHYCGKNPPSTMHTSDNQLFVRFISDGSNEGIGFKFTYEASNYACGGILYANNGSFHSPNWPQNFPENSECTWTIIAHESKHLEITFDKNFQIPDSTVNCGISYVKVWGGTAETAETLLATLCGSVDPGLVISPANIVTVRFQSEGSVGSGFSASFTDRCGANFTASSGRIISPNYPDNYDSNLNCEYLINTSDQRLIILQFESFDVEGFLCDDDSLKIYSGTTANGKPIATLCGFLTPRPISNHSPMLLVFKTNHVNTGTGFVVNYNSISCGGSFQESAGIISSPTYSCIENHSMNCTYHITVGKNRIVKLKFNEFDIDTSSACTLTYVAVYDGPNSLAPLLGQFCGAKVPPVLRSTNNSIFLVFKTHIYCPIGGWRASYTETLGSNQGCGGYLSNIMDNISSPDINFDGKYENNLDCVWRIVVPLNKIINMTFTVFVLEGPSEGICKSDYVNIYDGEDINSPLVGPYCGSELPPSFVSSSNFLTVRFISGSSVELAGFNATYVANDLVCGGNFNSTDITQIITPPGYPHDYPPLTKCDWIIDAPAQEQIWVTVQEFNLPTSPNCTGDYLEIKDWPLSDFGQIYRLCGSNPTFPDFYSYGRTIKITFMSKMYQSGNIFQLRHKVAGCSRQYNQSFGYLKSPGWPNVYPHYCDCTIILRAPESHKISLFFHAFSIENFPGCHTDYLEIKNGTESNGQLLARLCGKKLPNPIFPNFHALTLHFKSDVLGTSDGFEITWTSSPNDCGGTLFGSTGSFYSPNYPGTYSNNTDCEWIIEAPIGHVLTIHFTSLNIDDPGDCIKNYLKLYDGPDSISPPIGPYCGMESNIAPFTSTSYRVFVKFHAEYAVIPSGFRLQWTS
ncbi:cubilin isoform X2 [Stegostoma tigrinum]|uniref:cubilin isoform X2 n=1 Tax=Stegostoma tigrinum TaxID=3053191 RepID=UPI0028708F5C|nr:cubilin isoform X2 [Stegostoma tigrinum]